MSGMDKGCKKILRHELNIRAMNRQDRRDRERVAREIAKRELLSTIARPLGKRV